MAALQRPRLADVSLDSIESLPSLTGLKSAETKPGVFTASSREETFSEPNTENPTVVNTEVWFKSPVLHDDVIRRLNSIQLYAESHDQGFCDNEDLGNWTWFELGIYENEGARFPRTKDGITLIWRSHYNYFNSKEYGWCEGEKFDGQHDLIRCLEDGNVIAVRLCTRFQGWELYARNGFLVFDIGSKAHNRTQPEFGPIRETITTIQDFIQEVNVQNDSPFVPSIPTGVFHADQQTSRHERPLRVLSLDGGGVRGLMSLKLLKTVFEKAGVTEKPCEVFDMIGGTSTGGLIAIMLGRLEMTIDECINKYMAVMGEVFPEGWWSKNGRMVAKGEFYDEKPLENAIRKIVGERLGDPEAKLLDTEGKNKCKIFVMAVREDKANNRGPVFLRSYVNDTEVPEFPDIKVWEAARATSAAPAYFKAFAVDKYKLVDGGLGANNPLGWLWTETLGIFGPARHTACFLSIGTGMQPNVTLPRPGEVLKTFETEGAFASIATNTEIIHVLFRTLINAFAPKPTGKKYWRLNIGKKIAEYDEVQKGGWFSKDTIVHHSEDWAKIGDLDDVKALKGLEDMMMEYIADNQTLFEECAASLATSLQE
ncbi:hypothetical protein TWF696_000268 [Orbilia brochopaga]|uniref:PNPLA domain-containing protein n=1 Tax=Orbilia brochopaga TaxID=3140254 RepID=A0AAV9VAS3_9PEZI